MPPDELSDPNLTPLPSHPGIKYVARALAATKMSLGIESSATEVVGQKNQQLGTIHLRCPRPKTAEFWQEGVY